jgi:glyoxylase-like metal-dependent hydrolase (beta-lactamase superfamily II)
LLPVADQMKLIDSQRPFVSGYTPGRDEAPAVPALQRITWLGGLKGVTGVPGVGVMLVPGHTWGQQAMVFTAENGETVVFTPDVMPTVNHLGQAYSLAYDVEPYTSMVSRRWFLEAAAANGWTLVLDHEPGNPVQKVKRKDAWYELAGVG